MAYHLLTGLWEHLTRKEEFNVIILGLDNAGKTVRRHSRVNTGRAVWALLTPQLHLSPIQTFLEKVKTIFNDTPAIDPAKIAPTVGQNSE